ncbi:hypothetical protein HKD37_08G022980 [Glycine soja]
MVHLMQSYPARALDRRLQVDWARDPREGPRVLMSLRWMARLLSPLLLCLPLHLHGGKSPLKDLIEFQRSSLHRSPTSKLPSSGNQRTRASSRIVSVLLGTLNVFLLPFVFKPPTRKNHNLRTNMSHHSSSVNGEGTSHKDPLSRILDELSSLKLWIEKQERKEKGKKRVEEISQDERKKIREEERRKIMKEMKREKHVSYSSHNSCKSLSEELRDYYEGRHRSHLIPHSHRREKERKPQEANINLPYFHGKDNVEANLVWEIRVEQQLKKKSTSKSYGSHSYPTKDQGRGILGVTPSKPKDDKGKTIEKQAPKASMQEKTSSIKCFKCLGRGNITSQCPTTKTMIMRGQDIYTSQDKATTSPSFSESEKAKGEESSEEIYPHEEGQPLVTLASIATPLGLEFIPQVKTLLDEGLVRKSLNPCALLVPKIGIIMHQVPKIGGMMNVLSGATLFCKITGAPNIFMVCVHRDPLGSDQGVPMNPKRIKVIPEWPTPPTPLIEFVRNHVPSWEDAQEMGVEGRSPKYKEPQDLSILPSFLSKAHLGGEAPSSMAYSLVDGASSHLFSFVFRCISMVENHH